MLVICSQDGQFAEVAHTEGEDIIKLKIHSAGMHHYLPLTWVTSVENGKVKVDRPGEEAMQGWCESPDMLKLRMLG